MEVSIFILMAICSIWFYQRYSINHMASDQLNWCIRQRLIKGETRFWGWLLQKVWSGFTYMALYLSKTWSHSWARIWVYLVTYLWYTGTVTTNRSLYRMLCKGSKRQQIWRCAKPNVNQGIYYWDISSLSVWWAEDLNLTGRGSGRWAFARAPTFHDLINFDCPPYRFYWTYNHNNWWWEYWGLAVLS